MPGIPPGTTQRLMSAMNNTSEHDLGQEMGVADAMGAMGIVRRRT